jgi:hypothetical protein
MSGQFPTDPNFRSLAFANNRPVLINQTLSGKKSARQIGAQYFSFTVQMPPLEQLKAQEIFAFLSKQKGGFENFTIAAPLDNKGTSKNETDILVNGATSAGASSVPMDGFSHTNHALRAGDLIKFAGHKKVYMVQDEVTATGGGATVNIQPNLVANVADNEAVTVNKPLFNVYLENNDIRYTTDISGFYNISFDVREVIE